MGRGVAFGDGSVGWRFSGRRGRICGLGFWRTAGTYLWAGVLADGGDRSPSISLADVFGVTFD